MRSLDVKLFAPAKSFGVRLMCGPNAGGIARSAAAKAGAADPLNVSSMASDRHAIRGNEHRVISPSKTNSPTDGKMICDEVAA